MFLLLNDDLKQFIFNLIIASATFCWKRAITQLVPEMNAHDLTVLRIIDLTYPVFLQAFQPTWCWSVQVWSLLVCYQYGASIFRGPLVAYHSCAFAWWWRLRRYLEDPRVSNTISELLPQSVWNDGDAITFRDYLVCHIPTLSQVSIFQHCINT